MIQRIQTVYLLIAVVAMVVCAVYASSSGIALTAVASVAALASMGTVFLYKKRILQSAICRALCFIGVAIAVITAAVLDAPESDTIWTVATSLAAAVCWLLASRAITKDEKLVRSLDRIR